MQNFNLNTKEFNNNLIIDDEEIFDLELEWPTEPIDEEINVDVHAESIGDGLIYSLRNLGRVDIEYIAKACDTDKKTVIEKLKGSIYLDPEEYDGTYYKGYKTSDEYLSGNLLLKYQKATFANAKYRGLFQENVDALRRIMPTGLTASEIYYTISSPWIPKHLISDFFNDEFVYRSDSTENIIYNTVLNTWEIVKNGAKYRYSMDYRFGTKRISGIKIFEHILNSKSINIYDYLTGVDGKRKRILNAEETTLAQEKAIALNEYFKEYINKDRNRQMELVDEYNERFGYNVARIYNGDFLDFPNMNSNVTLFKAQRDAIARIIFNNNTLLAYNVGAGKTYIMVAAGEELKRIGLSKKNLYVVPNNIVGQWEQDYKYLYPNANIFVAKTKDFSPQKINDTLTKIRDGNFTSIIMAHSSFDHIKLSKDIEVNAIKQRLADINKLPYKGKTAKLLEKSLMTELGKLEANDAPYIAFNDLGITRLFIDEAHNYKNIPIKTNRGYIRGINTEGSTKCDHLIHICEYMNSLSDSGIIMATGTPISNSISDIYSIQQYLQNGELKLLDIPSFDAWLNMFTEESDEYEVDLDGSKYRAVKRLTKFHNLPELTSILSSISAFHYENNTVGLPKFTGYTDILVPKSREFKNYVNELSNRLDIVRLHGVSNKDDNLLKITSDGRKAALDLRLIDSNLYQNVSINKVNVCVENVFNIYTKTKEFRGTQLVFCDISVPNQGFNIYDEVASELKRYGVLDEEIAYIHDATTDKKRDELFEAMNQGKIRILIGSTQKLGTGVNVQAKLYAIHHLDIPWRPSDMVQREGRILRYGNTNPEIFIYRYITEGSFDAYSWQILENKQKFIGELLSNSLNDRTREDIEDVVLNYGEIKALAIGNPKLQEHVKLKNKISKLKLLQKKYKFERAHQQTVLLEMPQKITNLNEEINNIKLDIDSLDLNDASYTKEEKQSIRSLIWETLMDNLDCDIELDIIDYRGFKIKCPANLLENNLYLIIEGHKRYLLDLGTSEQGVVTRIDNFIERLPKLLDETTEKRDDLILKEESLKEELKNEIDYSIEIGELNYQLNLLNKELKING